MADSITLEKTGSETILIEIAVPTRYDEDFEEVAFAPREAFFKEVGGTMLPEDRKSLAEVWSNSAFFWTHQVWDLLEALADD